MRRPLASGHLAAAACVAALLCLTHLRRASALRGPSPSRSTPPRRELTQAPEQIHLALGVEPNSMNVGWSSENRGVLGNGTSTVQWGTLPVGFTDSAVGSNRTFMDEGQLKLNFTVHTATMTGLQPNTTYFYRVGDPADGWSGVHSFRTIDPSQGVDGTPLTFLVYGDMGTTNAAALPFIEDQVEDGTVDIAVHVGDFAYDMHDDNGQEGSRFMREIQPAASSVPYMTCPGNHEAWFHFLHYTYRFSNQPSNSGTLPNVTVKDNATVHLPEIGGMPNNWYFSWNSGPVHWVAFSTELYFFYGDDMVQKQWEWLAADLAAANEPTARAERPWIIVYGHRSLYCSCDGDCDAGATLVRDGVGADGSKPGRWGIEELLYKYGVDMFINGHEHNYERMVAVYQGKVATGELNGVITDPKSFIPIVTGSAGCDEDHEPFTRPQPPITAFRANTYGYSRLTVFNSTTLLWEQVQTDHGQPRSELGKVIDAVTIVQHRHGPFGAP